MKKSEKPRTNFGKRAKVPHYVPGHVLVPYGPNFTALRKKTREEAATIFPSRRLAERAVERTENLLFGPGEAGKLEIRQVL